MCKKAISWLLAVSMMVSLFVSAPITAYAAEVTQRYIYDAEVLPDGKIGVLFIYGGTSSSGTVTGGTLYYGVYDPDTQSWTQQAVTPGGGTSVAAKDAAMALDSSGNPHVVYVFTGGDTYGDIGYTYLSEASWVAALSISSNNDGDRTDGTLSSPVIAVNSSGTVHIAYIDSQGNNANSSYSRHPDLMYRTIDGGAIGESETIVHGFCENAGGSTYYQNNIVSSPVITNVGNIAYIGCASKNRYGGASDWNGVYTISPRPSVSSESFGLYYGSSSACERGFKQFAMAANGTGTYTLYYVSGTTTGSIPAGLHIANGIATPVLFSSPGTSITTGDITTSGTDVYAAGISVTTLTLFQNAVPTTKTLSTALSSTHTRMATVVTGTNQYILYTGNDTDKSLFIAKVPTDGGDLTEYQVPNKTVVSISGVTVADKVYDGSPVNPGGTLTVTGAVLTSEDLIYTYTSTDGGGYNSNNPPSVAGTYKLVISVPEDNANYAGSSADINFSITKKLVAVIGTTAVSRSYVAENTVVSLNTTNSVLSGVLLADEAAVVLDKSSVNGSVSTADVGTGKTVTVTGFSISGAKAGNYALPQPEGITVDIDPLVLTAPTVSLATDNTGGGLSATVSDAANTLGVGSYEVEIYEEGILKKTVTLLTRGSTNNIPPEDSVIVPENTYTAKAKAVADSSGNYADSVLGTSSSSAVAAYAPLSFADNAAYDLPTSNVDMAITPIDVSGGVTGGKAPYVFSASDLPVWAQISNSGVISGTPQTASSGGSATITVTDAKSSTQSITISYGVVNKGSALEFGGTEPPANKTYGDAPFDLALTYDGESSNVSYSVVSGPGMLSGSTLAITGAGSIVVRATGTSDNYATKTQDYTVNAGKKAVTITPAEESNTKVYGQVDPSIEYTHTDLVGEDTLVGTILTRSAGENAGSYAISVAASAVSNNTNYELALVSGSHYFTITKKPITISGAVVAAKSYDGTATIDLSNVTSLTLNGDLDSLTLGTDFEVSTASYTDSIYVGTGKSTRITLALKSTVKANNYEFTDDAATYTGTTADITPAVQNISAAGQTMTVTHMIDLSTIAASNAAGATLVYAIDGGISDYATLSGSVLTGTAPGALTININSASVDTGGSLDPEYTAAAQKQITVTVSAKTNAGTDITFEDGSITYGQTYTPSPTTTLIGGVWCYQYAGTANDGTDYNNTTAPEKAGSYTVTVTYENDTHIGTKTVGLTIAPKSISITSVTATPREYDGTTDVDITGGILNGIVGTDAVTPTVPTTGTIVDANVGNNKAVTLSTITLAGADKDNYTLTQPVDITVNIAPKVITFTVEAVAGQGYTVLQIMPIPTVRDGATTLTKDTDYTVGYGSNLNAGTNAGSITVAGIGNYLGSSAEVTFDIEKAVYIGAPVQGTKQVVSNTAAENVTYDLSTLAFPTGFSNKSFFSVTIENDLEGLLAGASVSGSTLTFDVADKAAGISGELHVVVGSDNYNNYTAVITVTTVDKTPVTVSGVTVVDKTYNASSVVPGGTPTNGDGYSGIYEYWYNGTGSTVYGSATAPTNAGDYRLTVRIPAADTTYTGEQTVNFSIFKAPLTVKPQNMSIYIGDSLPTPIIAYEGIQGGDVATTVAQLSSGNLNMEIKDAEGIAALANSATVGSYAIVFIGSPVFSATDNYTIATAPGVLTITNRPSGGGDGGGTTLPPAPMQEAHVSGSIGAVTVEVKTDTKTGSASAELTAAQMSGGMDVVVTMPKIDGVTNNTLGIPVPSLSDTSGKGSVTLNTVAGNIILPSDMLAKMDAAPGSKAQVSIGTVKTSDLPSAAQDKVGNRPIVSLRLSIDGKTTAWNNPDAPVTVSIPYTPTAVELQNPNRITVYYIDGSGNLLEMKEAKYDPATKAVIFTTTHFSYYAVGYKVSATNVQFSDVLPSTWYYDAVTFIAEKGITTGTGNGKFSPEAVLTRGQFIVMLMRAYGIESDASPVDNFADAGNTYYTNYLAAAKRLGISAGIGNNLFAPHKEITRQEMFTLLYNALTVIGELPEGNSGKQLSDFSDASSIAFWAKKSMTLLVETGTISDRTGKLAPTDSTTRAEMAQVLYNLLTK